MNMPIYLFGLPFLLGFFGLVTSAAFVPDGKRGWLKTSIIIGVICFVFGLIILTAVNFLSQLFQHS
jgi:hypothetical protein